MSPKVHRLARALTLVALLATGGILHAQPNNGTITGFAYDASNGDPVPQVAVEIAGPATFDVKTDTEGGFMLNVPPGTYTVTYNSQRYMTSTVEGVTVTAGEVSDASTVLSGAGATTTVEVVATIEPEVATAASLLVERKLADTVSDSISGEEISQGTASDAAQALESVTGVSVVGDRFVYVRGLGERYSATSLNNSMLASTEPDRRVVPLDLFPANLIDNIKVLKTYSADLSGEFSAGLVQIETTEFPSKPTLSASYTTGWNSRTHYSDGLNYPGGDLDFWGFDDGTRELPSSFPEDTRVDRFNFSSDELQTFGRSLPANWEKRDVRRRRPDQTFNVVAGDTFGKLGVVGAVTFSNSIRSRFDQVRNFWRANPDAASGLADPNEVLPNLFNSFNYNDTQVGARLGAIANISYRFNPENKITFRNFLSRDTDNDTRFYTGFQQEFNRDVRNNRLRWIERTLYSGQLGGEHLFTGLGNSILIWKAAYSRSTRDEPDLRENLYVINPQTGEFEFFDDSQSAFRMFNDQTEHVYNPGVDLSTPFYSGSWTGSVKFGFNFSRRERDFLSRRFRLALRGGRNLDRTLPPNELFGEENIRPTGFEITETTRVTDRYDGTRDVYGGYGMVDLANGDWRFILGLRVEKVDQNVISSDPFGRADPQEAPFEATNYLPSVNVVYSLSAQQNLRFGFSQTVSRPDFRELALFDFTDIAGGRTTIGNPDLVQTQIRNFDGRWEMFPGGNQLIAASFFYKTFDNPIERTVFASSDLITSYANADSARNLGFEVEFRRSLDFIGSRFRPFAVSSNFTFVDSTIMLGPDAAGTLTNTERPMQGQSRYVANGIVEFAKPEWRSATRFYVNYFSSRITDVGAFGLPDLLQRGVTTLDLVNEFALTEDGKYELNVALENLTNATWLYTQGPFDDAIFERWTKGRTFKVGLKVRIF